MSEEEITRLQLDVYMTRKGPWNPERGEIEIPDDWEFLPSGDSFLTRQVTAAGTYWVAIRRFLAFASEHSELPTRSPLKLLPGRRWWGVDGSGELRRCPWRSGRPWQRER
jgi:hypothetical protein